MLSPPELKSAQNGINVYCKLVTEIHESPDETILYVKKKHLYVIHYYINIFDKKNFLLRYTFNKVHCCLRVVLNNKY